MNATTEPPALSARLGKTGKATNVGVELYKELQAEIFTVDEQLLESRTELDFFLLEGTIERVQSRIPSLIAK